MNSWNTCSICLHAARNPYCCPNGDVFCKECILELILSNTEIKKEKEEKQPDQKEIDMFLRNQRIAPNDWNINENGTKIIKKNKRKVRCLCPACKKRIKWKDMLQLEYDESKEGPICCGCEKIMNGNIKTERLACNHVICSDCFKYMVEVDKQCPKCGKDIVLKKTKKGRRYFGCENNPECDFMSWQKPVSKKCPKCGGYMVEKGNKIACADETCGYIEAKTEKKEDGC